MYRAWLDASSGGLPAFYQQRMTGPPGTSQIFTDPSLIFAGGVDVFAGRHFSIRPEVSVRLVMGGSDTYAVTMATVRATYHFDLHEVGK